MNVRDRVLLYNNITFGYKIIFLNVLIVAFSQKTYQTLLLLFFFFATYFSIEKQKNKNKTSLAKALEVFGIAPK